MEPTLMVIGLNHRTAHMAMRERFWISENRRYEVLQQLKTADSIEEVVVLSTCCRTEFIVWASEPSVASNSVLHFLAVEHGLKLSEWEHFYRLLDESALTQIFRTTCGLDSLVPGDPQIAQQVKAAWEQSGTVGATGRFLNAVIEKALSLSAMVRQRTGIENLSLSIPKAAQDLAIQVFGSIEGRTVLLLGAGSLSELVARDMVASGAGSIVVIDQSEARARELAMTLGGTAASLAERWKSILRADIVISATGCPHVVLTREEAERIADERNRAALMIFDLDMPRDVEPEAHRVDGILLYDLDALERAARCISGDHREVSAEAEKIVAAEAQAFHSQLQAEIVVPTGVALRRRLEHLCRQELESFIDERGPFTREQDQALHAVTSQVICKIASSLARELKELPGKEEQERMTAAVNRLFHLEPPKQALAGTKSENEENDPSKHQPIAINY